MHARVSGVADHYALNDAHALAIARRIVANLNRGKSVGLQLREPREPLYPAEELYGVIPADVRKPYDVRDIAACVDRRRSIGACPETRIADPDLAHEHGIAEIPATGTVSFAHLQNGRENDYALTGRREVQSGGEVDECTLVAQHAEVDTAGKHVTGVPVDLCDLD